MASAPSSALSSPPVRLPNSTNGVDKLTSEIFSILENNFLFGYPNKFSPTNHPHLSNPGKVRILSIDAGGDAIVAAKTLLHLQSSLRRKSGNPAAHIADFFDVVTGAGLGGVLAGLLFTRGKDGCPMFTADEALKFILDNHGKFSRGRALFRRTPRAEKVLGKIFGDLTLKDTLKAVLIPCYDLRTGAPFLFSRADALEMDGCDFRLAGVCGATVAERAMALKSTDGRTKVVAVGGGLGGMTNPTAAAITHVLNNKQEFPVCRGVEDLLVVSLGNGVWDSNHAMPSPAAIVEIAANGAADMVDQAVSMAFGEWRASNYVRIQGNVETVGVGKGEKMRNVEMADQMLGQKNVESTLFIGKKIGELTNMQKVEMFAGEVIQEQERRNKSILPVVLLKNSTNMNSPRRSSSATTLSTLSSY